MSILRKHVLRLAVIGAAVSVALIALPKSLVERVYSMSLYLHVQHGLTRASNLVAFSLFDMLIIAVAAAWLLALIGDIRRERGSRARAALAILMRSIVWTSVLYLAFMFLWGFNYRRLKLTEKLRFDSSAISPQGAVSLATISIDRLNRTYNPAHASPSSTATLKQGFDRAQRELGVIVPAIPARPKGTLLQPFFRSAGVAGMTDPYFLETLIDDSVLPIERSFVIAHEWGHLAGFADEAEASFVGWLTCVHGSAADEYSAWLFVFEELMPAIRPQDRAEMVRRLAPGPVDDLRSIAERRRQQVNPHASRISSFVYDGYLKANRVPSGIANYGEVTSLLLGVRFGEDWTPQLDR